MAILFKPEDDDVVVVYRRVKKPEATQPTVPTQPMVPQRSRMAS
jgi:hypothetical protein